LSQVTSNTAGVTIYSVTSGLGSITFSLA
jgi:hypothetical protein